MGISYNSSIVTNGLVLCLDAGNPRSYPGSGTSIKDATSTYGTSTMNSATYNSSNGGVFNFVQASGTYISTPLLSSSTANQTVCCWAYITLGTYGTIFETGFGSGYGLGIGDSFYIASNPGNNVVALFPAIRWISTGVSYGSTGWKFVTMSMDASSIPSIYVNASLIGTYTGTAPLTPTTNSYIGRNIGDESSPTDRAFNGNINGFLFYNRQLSLAEITQNFNATRGRYGI